jgi:diguanylate cyclase (GGDEF)-like protein
VHEPPIPADEERRLAALRSLGLLDTPAEERFDRITRMAQRLFDVPISLVSLVDQDRQWFKSHQGLEATETPRAVAFCAHAIAARDVMVVEDALDDDRFFDNPLVAGDPNIRFYAGAPIAGPDGSQLGTLCVIDREPRQLPQEDRDALQELAHMIEYEIAVTHLAIADELTGLSNRRGLQLLGAQVLEVCRRQHTPAVLVFADLDGLKAINDEHGHEDGDLAIKAAADALTSTFRRADVLARVGGDEFCALLAGTTSADEPIARLRADLAERSSATGLHLGISIGTATFDPDEPVELDALLAAADAAMYEEKSTKPSRR